jgi:hypothetical protein
MSYEEKELDTIMTMLADRTRGNIDTLFDIVFGFLRRRSDFFVSPAQLQEKQVLAALYRQSEPAPVKPKKTIPKVPQKPPQQETPEHGGITDRYLWDQTFKEVTLQVPFLGSKADVVCTIRPTHLYVGLRSNHVSLIDDDLFDRVIVGDSFWVMDGNEVHVTLQKTMPYAWWKSAIVGDPEIDISQLTADVTDHVDDLEGKDQVTVKRMLFDQHQKMAGLPTSDEIAKQEAMTDPEMQSNH